jgi:predicted house-cleaning noncanonical NTP pyrophosphatase (MazG superfamily)
VKNIVPAETCRSESHAACSEDDDIISFPTIALGWFAVRHLEGEGMKIAQHIDRFGEIRKMFVDYFQYVLLKKDNTLKGAFFKAAREEYGDPLVTKSEEEFHEFMDSFVYSYRFPDHLTVIDRFISETSDLNEKEKAIVLGWKDPVAGVFQVKRVLSDEFPQRTVKK